MERSLGRPDVARDVLEALLYERGHHRRFAQAVEDAARDAARAPDEHPRRDLTAIPTFTIDPPTAKDYDDALSVERVGEGLRLRSTSPTWPLRRAGRSARRRGRAARTSAYVLGAVEPMLPHALSSEACSLMPGVERRAVTVEVDLAPGGRPRAASFYRSLIRSDARLEYGQVDRIFAGRERAPEAVAEPLALARELAADLRAARLGRAPWRSRARSRTSSGTERVKSSRPMTRSRRSRTG